MWVHLLDNKQYNLKYTNNCFTKKAALLTLLDSLKFCKELGDKIEIISLNEFRSYRNNKLCIICKIYNL